MSLRLFALNASRAFGTEVSKWLDVPLSPHKEDRFPDGEQYLRSLVNVRGRDTFVIQSLYSDAEESIVEKFTRLLFFIGSLRDASAASITAVIPYIGFFRQDRKTESRAPITSKYVAIQLESMGARRLLTMDVHSLAAMQNAFRKCIPDNLEAKHLLANAVVEKILHEEYAMQIPPRDFVTISPDEGGINRTRRFRQILSQKLRRRIGMAFVDKYHEVGTGDNVISAETIIGNVEDKYVITVDDMISSGATLSKAKSLIIEAGGTPWGAAASHALCVPQDKVNKNLIDVGHILTTNSITSGRLDEEVLKKTEVLSCARLFAQAIRRIYEGESISDLLDNGDD
jgi:ribose-phosphate pyrophosphokinase